MKIYPYIRRLELWPGGENMIYIPNKGIIGYGHNNPWFTSDAKVMQRAREEISEDNGVDVPDTLVKKLIKSGKKFEDGRNEITNCLRELSEFAGK